jgi:alpha-beta hydrolase superfamily lysophospholipase
MGEFEVVSYDGLRLYGYDWQSYQHPESPRAVIILLHGIAEYCGRYEHVAQFYNENDIAVVSMDLRGHGLSEGEHLFIPNTEALFQDIDYLVDEARHRYPSCPAILYGHSMGGNLALSYTLNRYPNASDQCPYQAVIVTGPWIRLAGRLQPPRPIGSIIRTIGRFQPTLRFPLRFNPRVISRNTDIVGAYAGDPYIRRTTTLSLAGAMGGTAKMLDRTACIFHIPVLIQHGAADSLTSHEASLKFCNRGKNTEFKSWPNCYHELHHEPERDDIFNFTLDWIHKKLFVYQQREEEEIY